MARRAHGEGTVYQRKDGRWVAEIDLGYVDSKRVRPTRYATTQKEALAKLDQLRAEAKQGVRQLPERLTVGEYLDRWFEECIRGHRKPNTVEGYDLQIRKYIKPHLGKIPLKKLQPEDVMAMINALHRDDLKRTAQYAHSVLRAALKQAERWRHLTFNAAALVKMPKFAKKEPTPLTPDQARIFLDAVAGNRLEALYTVAVGIGLRQGEAFALRWSDIDMEEGRLTVNHSLERSDGAWCLASPKTAGSRRGILLPLTCKSALAQHKLNQDLERTEAASRWQENDLVFATPIGTPLDSPNVLKQLKKHMRGAGLPEIRFHDLRHTCATLLLIQGIHPRVVMEILGHSSITVTMNIYSHVMLSHKVDAVAQMDLLLKPSAVSLAVREARRVRQ